VYNDWYVLDMHFKIFNIFDLDQKSAWNIKLPEGDWKTRHDKALPRPNELYRVIGKSEFSFADSLKREHRDDDLPAYVTAELLSWYDHGVHSRNPSRGPASEHSPEFPYADEYVVNGVLIGHLVDGKFQLAPTKEEICAMKIAPPPTSKYDHKLYVPRDGEKYTQKEPHGTIQFLDKDGKLNRENDLPAYVGYDHVRWYSHGVQSRHPSLGPSFMGRNCEPQYYFGGKYIGVWRDGKFVPNKHA
jgi:hypothetical protein